MKYWIAAVVWLVLTFASVAIVPGAWRWIGAFIFSIASLSSVVRALEVKRIRKLMEGRKRMEERKRE